MDEILQKLADQQAKIDAVYVSVEKTRKYFLWTLIATVVTFVLPLIALAIILPMVLSQFSSIYGGLL